MDCVLRARWNRVARLGAAILLSLFVLGGAATLHGSSRKSNVQTGLASFYDDDLHGEETASGRKYDKTEYVAAHPTYPLGTVVRVTNLENGRRVTVRIIDRGPSRENRVEGVVIDLSRRAARQLGFIKDGRVKVRTEVLKWGEDSAGSEAAAGK